MPNRRVVSNTSPLLYLHQVGQLDLLQRLYGRIARLNGLTITGTLGVLVKAKREGLLPSIVQEIDALRRTTMHLTQELIEAALREAGEFES